MLFLCLFASQAALLVLSPVLPDVARDLGVSTATAGQLRSLSGLTGGATAVLLALAPRRPGLRDLLTAGAALVAAGSLLSAAAPSFALLGAAQGVAGIGIGLLVAVGIAAAGEWPVRERRPGVLAWAIAGMPAAWIAGMPVVGAVANVSWRVAWLVPAVVALAVIGIIRRRPADRGSSRVPGRVGVWRDRDVARFAAGELLANAAWASVLTYAGALLRESTTSPRRWSRSASAPWPAPWCRAHSSRAGMPPGPPPDCLRPSRPFRPARSSCSAGCVRRPP